MRIAYNTSRVGEGTSWVATAAAGSPITVTSPNGGETNTRLGRTHYLEPRGQPRQTCENRAV